MDNTQVLMDPLPPEADKPEVKEAFQETRSLANRYLLIVVTDTETWTICADALKGVMGQKKTVDNVRLGITRPMDAAKQKVMDLFRGPMEELEEAEVYLKGQMVTFKDEQDRIAREQQRIERERAEKEAARLREEARKADELAAEKERKRLAEEQTKADERAAAERERIAQERAAAQSEEDKRRVQEQEEAAKRRREEEQERLHQERLAAEAEQRERTARAETLEARAEITTTAPVRPGSPKVKGISTRKKWTFEIVDSEKVPDKYKTIDERKIRGVVTALKGDTSIPGVRVYAETIMSAGTK